MADCIADASGEEGEGLGGGGGALSRSSLVLTIINCPPTLEEEGVSHFK